MGLCKCPKKKVTNQFCFEHRVNVCEHCMVSNHSKCVVQSYLQWLQDSDYDPNCHFCKTELSEGDCVRLSCYHVFHWECLNNYAEALPPYTSPSGYTCPICNICIFPQPNAVSPVTEALKNALLGANWARIGLGYPMIENNLPNENSHVNNIQISPVRTTTPECFENETKPAPINVTAVASHLDSNCTRPEPYGASYSAPYPNTRKMYDSTEYGHYRPSIADHDEDKYKRRSAFEWFSRWFKSRTLQTRNRRKDSSLLYKKWVVVLVLCLIGLCTLSVIFLKLGRASADSDPLLDPHLNPNIRVEENGQDIRSGSNIKIMGKSNLQEHVKELLPA